MKLYWNKYDTWIGLFREPKNEYKLTRFYLILFPCLVIKFDRSWSR